MLLIVSGCGSLVHHRVDRGDTLYSVSFRYGQDYRDVARWNDLSSPYTIFPGQMLRVAPPSSEAWPDQRAATGIGEGAPVTRRSASPGSDTVSSSRTPTRAPARATRAVVAWQWPTQGKLLSTYSSADARRKGIDIGGRLGQSVYAAAAGRVVYAGSGLLRYGNLIIVKHSDELLSAYGYNRALHVKEGDAVGSGQHIADMGAKEQGAAALHFQIRVDGKPVNPLRYLPKPRS